MSYTQKPLKNKSAGKISEKTMEIHHGKLYKGYVDKANEIGEGLKKLRQDGTASGNTTYSQLRGLKQGETFAVNGIYLHENYFGILDGDGDSSKALELSEAISQKWGSVQEFIKYFTECGMAARGWAILCWDINAQALKQYNGDAHNQAVWGCIPVIAMDVYEHSYMIDFGGDRKSYIQEFFSHLNWEKLEEIYKKAKQIKL